MKSKATLSLIEQLLMICVFAIAAAVCLRVFSQADALSREKEIRDFGVSQVTNAAEAVRYCRGDMRAAAELLDLEGTEQGFTACFDEALQPAGKEGACLLKAEAMDSGDPLLGAGEVSFLREGEEIFSLKVFWQEDAP